MRSKTKSVTGEENNRYGEVSLLRKMIHITLLTRGENDTYNSPDKRRE